MVEADGRSPWSTGPLPGEGPGAEPLDAVTHLAAHQRNLRPAEVRPRHGVVALPPPLIAEVPGFEALLSWREGRIREVAEALGGGDGPLPVVDLRGEVDLPGALASLEARGIRQLTVLGSRDQPGFAREIRCRWPWRLACDGIPGEVPAARPSLGALLHEDPRPVVWLDGETVRLRDGAPLPPGATRALVALTAAQDPARWGGGAGASIAESIPYAIDSQRECGSWGGLFPPVARLGTEQGEIARRRWRARWEAAGVEDPVRPGCLGLDPQLERALWRDRPRAAPATSATPILAVCGLDGSGKSTQARLLSEGLRERGIAAPVLKLYRQGAFLQLADSLSARTRRGGPLACLRWSREVKLLDSLRVLRDALGPALTAADAVITDRYLETHVAAAASQLGWDLRGHPALAPFPAAAWTFWMEVDAEEAVRRLEARGDRLSADEHPTGLRGYSRAFRALADALPGQRLSARDPLEDNAACIEARALELLPSPKSSPTDTAARLSQLSGLPIASAPALPRGRRPVTVGTPQAGEAILGEETAALHQLMGPHARSLPAELWLMAWAGQVLLDLDTAGDALACIPLWPEAIHRMEGFRDLTLLQEAQRQVWARVEVGRVTPPPGEHLLWRLLSPRAPGRLARAYSAELAALVEAEGWVMEAAANRA